MLTASQKIEIHQAHNLYTVRAHAPSWEYPYSEVSKALSAFHAKCDEYGVTMEQGEIASHEVVCNYDALLLQAIREGYRNEYTTPELIAYLERQVRRVA